MKNPKPLIIISVILIIILASLIYGYSQYKIYQDEYQGTESTQGEDVVVVIPEGATTKQIAQILKENGLIQYPSAFVKRVKESEYRGVLQPGEFTLNTGMNTWEMIEILGYVAPTRTVMATLTIPEGFSIEQIAARVEEQGLFTEEEFLDAVQENTYNYDFLNSIPDGITVNYRLQGFLFPATYDIYEDTTAHDLVDMMLQKFDQVYNEQMRAQAEAMNYTAFEVVNRAAIVEREAKIDEERPMIAGVINNRLEQGMMLQMCPTVLYPITNGIYDKSEVTYDDLEVESPYNTYKNTGLPVGPICNPGEVSLNAVLYPAEHNYLYYHVDNEETGSHIFTETYEEHVNTQ
ncbi:MAG: endolytic transglycosylase MltG [Lachnospiraceae bacterium]|nr:endolytic transglycosylase MltG [Lachnospiraceae bacterium]